MSDQDRKAHFEQDFLKSETNEQDDFWEIDMLLPKTRAVPRRAPGATDTAEISFSFQNRDSLTEAVSDSPLNLNPEDGDVIVRHAVPQHMDSDPAVSVSQMPMLSYETEGSLIHRVSVYPWSSVYRYYREFCADAARYLNVDISDEEVPYVSFFSYVPQYSQLRKDQLRFYLYWRHWFRQGKILKTDDSYLYLYIYEIINTAGHETDPEDGLKMLFRLFYSYGKQNARLSRLLSEWIVDYALIFRLAVPETARTQSDYYRLYQSTLKEFYVSSPREDVSGYADLLLRFCSAYDYQKSHFYRGENCSFFDRYLPGALSAVLSQYSDGARLFVNAGMKDSHMVRNAFEQALCSYRIRFRLEVDYASFSRSHEMRYLVSDILKYTENRLRAFLGIKSRLTVYSLSQDVKNCIDQYCDMHFPRKSVLQAVKSQKSLPSYEKLYDLPDAPLSLSHAAEIELDSWETTRKLTEAFSDSETTADHTNAISDELYSKTLSIDTTVSSIPVDAVTPEDSFMQDDSSDVASLKKLLGELYPFLEAAYHSDYVAQRAFSEKAGMLPDLIADRINELAFDMLGDILLSDTGSGYDILDDYRSLFETAL